jgi:uncharacterized lipoprotein
MLSVTRGILLAGGALLLAGCAQFSPQQIQFQPSLDSNSLPSGAGTTVTVLAEDRRSSSEIGVRGGAYSSSSVISASGDLRRDLQQLSERVLERAGYNRVDMNADVELTFAIEELSYQVVSIDAARKEATGAARFSVEAVGNGTVYSNSFRAQRTIETLRYPSEEENSDLMNYVFDAALERMYADPGLESFLNQRR